MWTSSPAAVSWNINYQGNARFDVFVSGTDGALWQTYYQNGCSTWIPLGGQFASRTGPAVASWSAGRLDVFVQGTDNQLWHKWWNVRDVVWLGTSRRAADGVARCDVPVDVPATHNIHMFVRGSDGALWQK